MLFLLAHLVIYLRYDPQLESANCWEVENFGVETGTACTRRSEIRSASPCWRYIENVSAKHNAAIPYGTREGINPLKILKELLKAGIALFRPDLLKIVSLVEGKYIIRNIDPRNFLLNV